MKNLWLLFLWLTISSAISAQSFFIENVLTTTGGSYGLTAGSVDWTLGECIIESYSGDPYLENGFLHDSDINESITSSRSNFKIQPVRLWPNPTHDYFFIDVPEAGFEVMELRNLQGQLMQQWKLAYDHKYQLNRISPGHYLIVLKQKGEIIHLNPLTLIF